MKKNYAAGFLEAIIAEPDDDTYLDNIDDDCLRVLEQSPVARGLRSLTFWSSANEISPAAVQSLVESGAVEQLLRLHVGYAFPAEWLARPPGLPRLTQLGGENLFLDTLQALSASPHLPALRAVFGPAPLGSYRFAVARSHLWGEVG